MYVIGRGEYPPPTSHHYLKRAGSPIKQINTMATLLEQFGVTSQIKIQNVIASKQKPNCVIIQLGDGRKAYAHRPTIATLTQQEVESKGQITTARNGDLWIRMEGTTGVAKSTEL